METAILIEKIIIVQAAIIALLPLWEYSRTRKQ